MGSIEFDEWIGDILVIFFRQVTRGNSGLRFFSNRRWGLLSVGTGGGSSSSDGLIIALLMLDSLVLLRPLFWSGRRGLASALARGSRL